MEKTTMFAVLVTLFLTCDTAMLPDQARNQSVETDAAYGERLRVLEQRVNQLEQIHMTPPEGNGSVPALFSNHPAYPVAFYVQKAYDMWAGSADTLIPWETVQFNAGGGWNSLTNMFIAPVRGYYVFHVHTYANDDRFHGSYVWLAHNSRRVQFIDAAWQHWQSASGTAILRLEQSDLVFCQLVARKFIRGSGISHFAGFLLHSF